MRTILQALKAMDENVEGATIAKALDETAATIAPAIEGYLEASDEEGEETETTYYTLTFCLSNTSGVTATYNGLPTLGALSFPAGTSVTIAQLDLPSTSEWTLPDGKTFQSWSCSDLGQFVEVVDMEDDYVLFPVWS